MLALLCKKDPHFKYRLISLLNSITISVTDIINRNATIYDKIPAGLS